MNFKILCILVLRKKAASALEGLNYLSPVTHTSVSFLLLASPVKHLSSFQTGVVVLNVALLQVNTHQSIVPVRSCLCLVQRLFLTCYSYLYVIPLVREISYLSSFQTGVVVFNLSNAEATFVNSTRIQRFLKTI